MISEKEFIKIFKKRGTSFDSCFLSDDDLKIDHFKIDETFKKKFNSFFKENKLVILRKLVYKLAPKEVIEKYHLNDFLIN
ncbi:MAG: hypothetical protein J6X03_05960, partial [Bacilli bacterium]|nr:hypothetical protein [Bacilli bacterium]